MIARLACIAAFVVASCVAASAQSSPPPSTSPSAASSAAPGMAPHHRGRHKRHRHCRDASGKFVKCSHGSGTSADSMSSTGSGGGVMHSNTATPRPR